MQPAPQLDTDALQKTQLEYAQKCFQNAHELNRMMDQKASFLLAAVALVTGALGIIASAALGRKTPEDWQWYFKLVAFSSMLLYLFAAFIVIFVASQVFRAKSTMVSPNTTALGLLFPLMLLKRYPDATQYKTRLVATTQDEIIDDYAHQIIEISNIYRQKQSSINLATRVFQWQMCLWLVSILLLAFAAFLLPA
jgi:uncharacterized membrane protein (DUF2068 family)